MQKARAYDEPMIVMFLRLCYWYHKCDITGAILEKKNKEIRDKLKASNSLIKLITINGFHDMLPREWIRQAIGVIYELICHHCRTTITTQYILKRNMTLSLSIHLQKSRLNFPLLTQCMAKNSIQS